MSFDPLLPALVFGAYLLGSIPFGLVVARLVTGKDVREGGSGNIGATNVARVAGKKLGVLTLALDAAKGAAPAAAMLFLAEGDPRYEWWVAGAAFAAFLGHCFSVFLKFKGGKGVATAFGVFLVLAPLAALAGFAAYALIFAIWRVSSIGSLVASVVVPSAVFGLYPLTYGWLAVAIVVIVVFKHRGNIERLAKKAEEKL